MGADGGDRLLSFRLGLDPHMAALCLDRVFHRFAAVFLAKLTGFLLDERGERIEVAGNLLSRLLFAASVSALYSDSTCAHSAMAPTTLHRERPIFHLLNRRLLRERASRRRRLSRTGAHKLDDASLHALQAPAHLAPRGWHRRPAWPSSRIRIFLRHRSL